MASGPVALPRPWREMTDRGSISTGTGPPRPLLDRLLDGLLDGLRRGPTRRSFVSEAAGNEAPAALMALFTLLWCVAPSSVRQWASSVPAGTHLDDSICSHSAPTYSECCGSAVDFAPFLKAITTLFCLFQQETRITVQKPVAAFWLAF